MRLNIAIKLSKGFKVSFFQCSSPFKATSVQFFKPNTKENLR